MRFILFLQIILVATAGSAQGGNYAVLDSSLAAQLVAQCSRWSPTIVGSWNPSEADIQDLESDLDEVKNLRAEECCMLGAEIEDPTETLRQYAGIVLDGHRVIYVNAFPVAEFDNWPSTVPKPDWRTTPYVVCDGGWDYWGVLYDPVARTFSKLAMNGIG